MAFMQPQITGLIEWYEVDGPMGTEHAPVADVGRLSEEEMEAIREVGVWPGDCPLKDYFQNREVWSIDIVKKVGARLSAPGYMDCTDWNVADTEEEAKRDLLEYTGTCPECETEEGDEESDGCTFCNPDYEAYTCSLCPDHEFTGGEHIQWHEGRGETNAIMTKFIINPREGTKTPATNEN